MSTNPYIGSIGVPSVVFDRLLPILGEAELKCFLYIVRHTLGYGKNTDHISLSQFETGIIGADGSRVDAGTGCGRKAIITALKRLAERELIVIVRRVARGRKETNCYQLNPAKLTDTMTTDFGSTQSHEDSNVLLVVESQPTHTHEDHEEKNEIIESRVVLTPTDEHDKPAIDAQPLRIISPDTRPFVAWWLQAQAVHTGNRVQEHLSVGDAATLARWLAKGTSQEKLIPIIAAGLEGDREHLCYALAYLDHHVRRNIRTTRSQSDRRRPTGPTPAYAQTFTLSAAVPPGPDLAASSARLLRCDVCRTVFISPDTDPCLLRMSTMERRKWGSAHAATHHRQHAAGQETLAQVANAVEHLP